MDLAIELIKEDGDLVDGLNNNDEYPFDVADVKAVCKDGNTALHIAASVGEMDDVVSLIGRGANLTVENKNGDTPLRIAEVEGNEGAIKAITDNINAKLIVNDIKKDNGIKY